MNTIIKNLNELEDYLINKSKLSVLDIQLVTPYLFKIREEAITVVHSCEKLKVMDITDVTDIEDPYWREYIKGKQ